MDSTDVTAGTNATALQYNNLRKDLILAKAVGGTETDAATITIDWSDNTKGKIRTVTIAGSRTLAFSNVTAGQFLIVRIVQGGSGGYTPTYPADVDFSFGISPILSVTAGDIDWVVFYAKTASTFDAFHAGTNM